MNAFRQLHLNIKSNLPSPFCSSPLAERDDLCQCAPGEGKGADEAQRVTWEQAGMVQGTDLRTTCTFSQDPGQERGQLHLASRATHVSAFDQAKQAGLHVANVTCSNVLARSVVRLLDHVWRPPQNVRAAATCICLRDEAGVHPPHISVSTSAIADRDEERSVNPAGWTATEGAFASERRRWPRSLKACREGVCPGKKSRAKSRTPLSWSKR